MITQYHNQIISNRLSIDETKSQSNQKKEKEIRKGNMNLSLKREGKETQLVDVATREREP